MTALEISKLCKVVRRIARHRRRQSQRRAGRTAADDRAERRRQDDAVQPHHRRDQAGGRVDQAVRARNHRRPEPPPRASGAGAHLPDHHAVPARHHRAQRHAGAARALPNALEPDDRARPATRADERAHEALQRVGLGTWPSGRCRDLLWRAPAGRNRHGARAEAEGAAARRALRRPVARGAPGRAGDAARHPARRHHRDDRAQHGRGAGFRRADHAAAFRRGGRRRHPRRGRRQPAHQGGLPWSLARWRRTTSTLITATAMCCRRSRSAWRRPAAGLARAERRRQDRPA